jgi:hypothetical protein
MKGILVKNDYGWQIKLIDQLHGTFYVNLDPSDAKDADLLYGTELTLENKVVSFSFKEIDNSTYGKLKNPNEDYQLNEFEQKILNQTFKNSIKKYPTIDGRLNNIQITLGNKCIVCEEQIKLSEMKQMCDQCLNALKSLILEKRALPK